MSTDYPRISPEKKAAMRAHAAQVIAERKVAGFTPDGRLVDFTAYAAHLRAQQAAA